jgi:lipopolysaccharide/colanic/teichoic acid biosynthesis glycosyltransferase
MPRFLELMIVLVVLVVFLLPMGITAIIIHLTLGAPVFFRQLRAGKSKVPYEILKFRTMSSEIGANGQLLTDDLRQTPLTKTIRRLRFDELPQVLAILNGDMALVGPRPLLPSTIDEFGELGVERCLVRPGLSGWAQVSGNVNLSNVEKVALDVWYVHHRSMLLDIQILAETFWVLVAGERVNDARIEQAISWVAGSGLKIENGLVANLNT